MPTNIFIYHLPLQPHTALPPCATYARTRSTLLPSLPCACLATRCIYCHTTRSLLHAHTLPCLPAHLPGLPTTPRTPRLPHAHTPCTRTHTHLPPLPIQPLGVVDAHATAACHPGDWCDSVRHLVLGGLLPWMGWILGGWRFGLRILFFSNSTAVARTRYYQRHFTVVCGAMACGVALIPDRLVMAFILRASDIP